MVQSLFVFDNVFHFGLKSNDLGLVGVLMHILKSSGVMFEETSVAIGTEALQEELDTFLLFVFIDHGVLVDQLVVAMGELTLVSVPTRSSGYPVLAHFSLV